MNWDIKFLPEAEKDFSNLDNQQRILIVKSLEKVRKNPLPIQEGGYGKPLGNKNCNNLSGLLKIKLRGSGLRIVYKLIKIDNCMIIIVIGFRKNNEVYYITQKRSEKYNFQ